MKITKEKLKERGLRIREALAARSPEAKELQRQRSINTIASNGELEKRRIRKLAYWAKMTPDERREKLKAAQLVSLPKFRGAKRPKRSREWAAKQSASLKKRYIQNPEIVDAMAQRAGEWWANRRAQGLSGYTAKRTNSSLEQSVRAILDALGVEYVEQQKLIGYWPDFLIPSKKLIIECDGKYWHDMPGRAEHDVLRDKKLRGLGYTVIRLSEESINSDACAAVRAALELVA